MPFRDYHKLLYSQRVWQYTLLWKPLAKVIGRVIFDPVTLKLLNGFWRIFEYIDSAGRQPMQNYNVGDLSGFLGSHTDSISRATKMTSLVTMIKQQKSKILTKNSKHRS